MVEILCPHCEEEVELDDDAIGTYTCPHCDGEFEWGIEEIQIIHYEPDKSKSEKPWFIIAIFVQIFFYIQAFIAAMAAVSGLIVALPVILFLVVIVITGVFYN
jgi:hypothetical protein